MFTKKGSKTETGQKNRWERERGREGGRESNLLTIGLPINFPNKKQMYNLNSKNRSQKKFVLFSNISNQQPKGLLFTLKPHKDVLEKKQENISTHQSCRVVRKQLQPIHTHNTCKQKQAHTHAHTAT